VQLFVDFFTAEIANPHTRRAYASAVTGFLDWAEHVGIGPLTAIAPHQVATYVRGLGEMRSPASVKLHLAAIRRLFHYLVIGQVLTTNPAASVRGPRYAVSRGKTPVLTIEEVRGLIAAIPTDTILGLRDRALVGLLVYSFARIGAALGTDVRDLFRQDDRIWVRLAEKGGKEHVMPCHSALEVYLEAYLDAGRLWERPRSPLFQSSEGGSLSGRRLSANRAWEVMRARARQAGIDAPVGNHTFRATGITAFLSQGGSIEKAAQMASHSSTRTTQLYDRRSDRVSIDEVERMVI
jgi:site-specific recombinase XerD